MDRRRTLLAGDGLRVEIRAYPPGHSQTRHTDRHSCITLALKGGVREDAHAGSATLAPGDVLIKSHEAAHADQFGPNGATLASIVFEDDLLANAALAGAWRPRSDRTSLTHAFAALDAALASDEAGVQAAACDLLCVDETSGERTAPKWLGALKEELEQVGLGGVDVGVRAHAAGVHPAHLSRLFRRCFGASVTEHAQRHAVRRALAAITATPLSDLAAAAGFYDQSHMNRVFARVVGRTPGACRDLIARAAC